MNLTRRQLLTRSAAALGATLLRPASALAAEAMTPPDRTHGIKLGLATYSLNTLPLDQVITVAKALGFQTVGLFRAHAPFATGTLEECKAAVQKCTDAGLKPTSTGVVNITLDEAAARKAFENLKGCGMTKFCGRPTPDALPLAEKLCKEYDLKCAIHNHGPTDLYPQGQDVLKAVKSLDHRIGLCLDVGHGWLADENPAATIRSAGDRLFELHLKDTKGPKDGKSVDAGPVAVGRGLLDFKGIMAALVQVKFAGEASFEYEEKRPDKVAGIAESVGYIRGLLAAM
jgi:sugar phosphate isomerase/epimerase